MDILFGAGLHLGLRLRFLIGVEVISEMLSRGVYEFFGVDGYGTDLFTATLA